LIAILFVWNSAGSGGALALSQDKTLPIANSTLPIALQGGLIFLRINGQCAICNGQ